jgi:hypothetical protein
MVGSPFILTRRDGRQSLLNTSQIVFIYNEDIDRATRAGALGYSEYDPTISKLYTIQVLLTSRREMEYVFATADERDAAYDDLIKAISPGVTIDIAAPRMERVEPPMPPKPTPEPALDYPDYSREELNRAIAIGLAQIKRDREQAASPAPAKPKPKKATKQPPQTGSVS